MKTLNNLIQGSPEWLAVRQKHFTASEAPAMLGVSKYMTRSELLRMKATGVVEEVSPALQRRYDEGHAAEAAARPLAERVIGEELYPVTAVREVDGLPLLASFDGITLLEDTVWETKLWNQELAAAVRDGNLTPHYWAQLEQQLLVSGASRAYFTTTDGTEENLLGMWYESVPERRAQLIAGWHQFAADLAQYQHVEEVPAPVAAPIMELPALVVNVEGRVISSNLVAFQKSASAFIQSIKTDLQTDQDFVDAENTVKFCKDGEERLELVKAQALAQTASIDELFRTIDLVKDELRAKRLELDKLVKSRKETIRIDIASEAKDALAEHVATLNKRLGKAYMPPVIAEFAAAMKGKKTVSSLREAASAELARAKTEASMIADQIQINLNSLRELAADHAFLFADTPQIVLKQNDDLVALIKSRIADHQAEVARKEEAERERIRNEELAKIEQERQAAEKAAAVQAATPVMQEVSLTVAAAPAPARKPIPVANQTAGTDTAESVVLAFIDAYESGSGIFLDKVYRRAKALSANLPNAAEAA